MELMDNHCTMHVINEDILDQPQKNILSYFFYQLMSHQTYWHFLPLKSAIRKIFTQSPTIQIVHIKVTYKFWRFFRVIIIHVFIICFSITLGNIKSPPFSPFLTNKYLSVSDIYSNFTPVIFNIPSQVNPEELK